LTVAGVSTSSFWISDNERKALIEFGDIEQEIRVEFVDVAGLHTYTSPESQEFF
jgi:hypothetical protein